MGLGGVIGVVLLVLGFVSLSVLPVNLAGLLLLALAAALFIAELLRPRDRRVRRRRDDRPGTRRAAAVRGPARGRHAGVAAASRCGGWRPVLAGRLAWRARRAPAVPAPAGCSGRHGGRPRRRRRRQRQRAAGGGVVAGPPRGGPLVPANASASSSWTGWTSSSSPPAGLRTPTHPLMSGPPNPCQPTIRPLRRHHREHRPVDRRRHRRGRCLAAALRPASGSSTSTSAA